MNVPMIQVHAEGILSALEVLPCFIYLLRDICLCRHPCSTATVASFEDLV